ncbi:MAG: BatA and WFA domain-containing protein [Chloroflexota bacterium]
MSLAAPALLGMGILIPIIVLFYLLKVRRREVTVSSTYLWQDLLRDLAAHEPWQRFHWSVLMVLQILVVALTVLALARPFFAVQAQEAIHAVIVLDGSASMRATDVQPSRFDAARNAALDSIRGLSEGSIITVVLALSQPRVLVPSTTDRLAAERGLAGAQPGFDAADMVQALSLAGSLNSEKNKLRAYVFTDGASIESAGGLNEAALAQLGSLEVEFKPVGVSAENVGITALSARPDPRNMHQFQVYARVHNFGDQLARSTLALQVDGTLAQSRQVELPGGGEQQFVFEDLPPGSRTVEARLAGTDIFPVDNAAFAVLDVRRASQLLLVSQGNLFLEKVLGLLPNTEVFRVAPRRYFSVDSEQYDVVVFDGFLPEALPPSGTLLINPPESALLSIEGEMRRPRVRQWERDDPLLRFVDLREVAIARAQRLAVPSWARVLAEADDGPLLLAGEREGRRTVVIPFDVRQSNLPLSAAFPILVANIVGYLEPAGQAGVRELRPGEPIPITAMPQVEELHIRRPSGPVQIIQPDGPSLAYDQTDEPGLYQVSQRAAGQTIGEDVFAVNVSADRVSDIRPRVPTIPRAGAGNALELVTVQREVWFWLVPPAIALLLVEWFWFHRRS